jgi:hypothetical protein
VLRFFVSLTPVTKNVFTVLFLVIVTVCFFWPLLFGGKILFFGDISLYFTPLLHLQQKAMIENGQIPLWNPRILCGTPFVGNPQSWPLYPTSLLLYWFPAEKLAGIMGAIQIFWAAVGTFCFLLARGRSRTASLLSAIAWGFGGALVSKMQFPNMIQTASWLPWLLLAAELVLNRPTMARSVVLGLVVGLGLLAAHPQMFLLQFYLGFAWVLWRLGQMKHGRRRRFVFLLVGFLFGMGLAAAQLLPTLELVRHSVRPDLPLAKANRFILPPYAILTNFLAPDFYGNPASFDNPYVGRGNFWEPCCYVGLLPFLLFVYGSVGRVRESETRFWSVVAFIGIWLAVGRDAGLFVFAFHVVPGLNRFHDAARFLFPATFAVACLAAVGWDHLLRFSALSVRRKGIVAAIMVLLTMVDVIKFAQTLNPTMDAAEFQSALASRPMPSASEGRLFQTDEGEIWGAFVSYRTYEALSSRKERTAFLQSLAPNLSMMGRWRDASGYEPVRLASVDALWAPIQDAARHRVLDSTGGVLDAFSIDTLADWNRVSGTAHLKIRPQAKVGRASRAQFWTDWRRVKSSSDAVRIILKTEWDGVPLLESSADPKPPHGQNASKSLTLPVTDFNVDFVEVNLPVLHPAGLVVLSDALYPGWIVTVDGIKSEPLCVNGAFRGVLVRENSSVVRWTFDPVPWRLGLFISLLTVGIMTMITVPAAASSVRQWRLMSRNGRD